MQKLCFYFGVGGRGGGVTKREPVDNDDYDTLHDYDNDTFFFFFFFLFLTNL